MTDVPADSFGLDVHLTLPAEVQADLDRSSALRAEAARSQALAAQLSRQAACRLREQGLTLREIGQAFQVSFQRAKQLVDEASRAAS
jgi:hypothetical protein